MSKMDWNHPEPGLWVGKYETKSKVCYVATAVLKDELWKTVVTRNGVVIDVGEWDGRKVAVMNATNAVIRAMQLRSDSYITEAHDEDN